MFRESCQQQKNYYRAKEGLNESGMDAINERLGSRSPSLSLGLFGRDPGARRLVAPWLVCDGTRLGEQRDSLLWKRRAAEPLGPGFAVLALRGPLSNAFCAPLSCLQKTGSASRASDGSNLSRQISLMRLSSLSIGSYVLLSGLPV